MGEGEGDAPSQSNCKYLHTDSAEDETAEAKARGALRPSRLEKVLEGTVDSGGGRQANLKVDDKQKAQKNSRCARGPARPAAKPKEMPWHGDTASRSFALLLSLLCSLSIYTTTAHIHPASTLISVHAPLLPLVPHRLLLSQLPLHQRLVQPPQRQQLRVRALLPDSPAAQHDDAVGVDDG